MHRPARTLTAALATLATAVLGASAPAAHAAPSACSSGTVTPAAANVEQVERSVLCLVNRERTSRGLRRLVADPKLARAAEAHSRDMVRRDFFDHVSPGGGTMLSRIRSTGWLAKADGYVVGENLAWGTGELATPESIVDGWMRSPGHRRTILTARFAELGVGVAVGAPGRPDGATYTTDFGAKG